MDCSCFALELRTDAEFIEYWEKYLTSYPLTDASKVKSKHVERLYKLAHQPVVMSFDYETIIPHETILDLVNKAKTFSFEVPAPYCGIGGCCGH